jgi:hypothetical protein
MDTVLQLSYYPFFRVTSTAEKNLCRIAKCHASTALLKDAAYPAILEWWY